ncbi:hypothetical protein GQ54DRAFT_63106 [Martensiomyces pterosporus]|nr:hypothetical protein GQ54DRAFT_63106 [Martensiomyces pterosporus]
MSRKTDRDCAQLRAAFSVYFLVLGLSSFLFRNLHLAQICCPRVQLVSLFAVCPHYTCFSAALSLTHKSKSEFPFFLAANSKRHTRSLAHKEARAFTHLWRVQFDKADFCFIEATDAAAHNSHHSKALQTGRCQ